MEKKKLAEDLEKNAVENCALQAAAEEQKNSDEKVMKLAEEQKIQKEDLHKRIIELEMKLDEKQALELEIEQLKGKLNVKNEMVQEGDLALLGEVDVLVKELWEKQQDLDDLDASYKKSIVHERITNTELYDARKELINGLLEMSIPGHIGIKRMGELNDKPFHETMKRKYREAEAEEKANELISLWQEYLKDSSWHPLKVVSVNGKHQHVIKEDDERLRELKEKYGDAVYDSVSTAIFEISASNACGGYLKSELWNYQEGRVATLKEGAEALMDFYERKRFRANE